MKRINYIDYAKAFGILMIVYGHCTQLFSVRIYSDKYFNAVAVPIFFVLSGLITSIKGNKNENINHFLSKKGRSLLIPYLIFSLINTILKFGGLFVKKALTTEIVKTEFVEFFITGNGTVWFLMTLFIVEIISFYLDKKIKNNNKQIIFISMFCLLFPYLINDCIYKPFGIQFKRVIGALGYYYLGYLINEAFEKNEKKYTSVFKLFMVIGIINTSIFGSYVTFFSGIFKNPVSSIVNSCCLSIGIISLVKMINEQEIKIIKYIGRNSMLIMLLHPIFLNLITFVLGDYLYSMKNSISYLVLIILFITIILIETPFIYLINNYLPFLIGKRNK